MTTLTNDTLNQLSRQLSDVITDATTFAEVARILETHLRDTRYVEIGYMGSAWHVYPSGAGGTSLLISDSYATCVEFALSLPTKAQS